MLSVGIFPDRLKYAVVKQILKNGDKSDVSNYRPISLLPAFSKVFEKVIYVRLYQHLANNNILIDEQFGFRPKSSTTAAAYNLINEVLDALNSKKLVGGIFCDLKKAFDSVDRDILISKLEFYGIRGKFNELIKSYLNNRYINTRQNFNLYQPQANLILYQKGVYYSGVKVFNNLSPNIKNLFSDVKRFKLELGKYLHLKSFYTLEEYYDSCKA